MTVAPTNAYGFYISTGWVDATNNYGFYGNIPAGTGRWNFYANGTADNYFAGKIGIGTTTPSFGIDLVSPSTVGSSIALTCTDSGAGVGSYLQLYRDSATPAANDVIGAMYSDANNSIGNVITYSAIETVISSPTSSAESGALVFKTTSSGTYAERMRITSAGDVTFAGGITFTPNEQTFNSSGTWTKPAFGNFARIQMWGGGGGGSRSGTTANIGAGGGGGYVEFTVPIASMGATATVTVGAAGTGRTGSSGSGTNGGNSAVTLGNGSIVYVSGGFGAINNNLGGNGGYGAITFSTTAVEDPSGNGSGASASVAAGAGYSYTGGGGGTATNNVGGKGGYGGGGGTRGTTTGNTSIFGGDGGTASVAGTQPGGGGGASSVINTNATNGGAGRVVITTF
jgi:hypothetical protein